MGDFDYEELDKAIKDLYLTDDDSKEADSKEKLDDVHNPKPTVEIESVPAGQAPHTSVHEAVASVRHSGGKSISIMGADEELVPVRKGRSTAKPAGKAKTINVSDDNKPKAKRIVIDRQDAEQSPKISSPKKISIADDMPATTDKPRQIEHHTFKLQPRQRPEAGVRSFRGNVSLRNEDIDVDIKTDDELLPKAESTPKTKPFAINKGGAEVAQSRRRLVHYGSARNLNLQHNPQRSLSQPMPKPVAFVPHVDIEAEPEPKAGKDPYEIPFLPDAKVEKRPLGGGKKVEVAVDPAIVGAGIHATADDTPKIVSHAANMSFNDETDSSEGESSKPGNSKLISESAQTSDDDFIGEFLTDMKKRRRGKADGNQDDEASDMPVVDNLVEPHTPEPVVDVAVSKVINNSLRHNRQLEQPVLNETPVHDEQLPDDMMAARPMSMPARNANLNRYQTKYTPKRGGGSWGWILLFILVIIAGSFAGVALYYYGL